MGFSNTITWTGRSITLSEVEEICRRARANGALGETNIHIDKAQTYNNPSDPGGEITITVRSNA